VFLLPTILIKKCRAPYVFLLPTILIKKCRVGNLVAHHAEHILCGTLWYSVYSVLKKPCKN